MPEETTGGIVPAAPRLSASWHRSETYGVSLDAVSPAFSGSVDDESLFYRCGHEVLEGLQTGLSGEPVSLMLTDADGIVLSRVCRERPLARSLDRSYLAPGFAFSEREAGTNGLGLALADRVPSLVRGDQHYCSQLHGYTCAAAPVLDPLDGALLGSINLTTWSERSAGLLLALAQTAAGHTAALMLARSRGATPRPTPRGEVFHVHDRPHAPDPSARMSAAWRGALLEVQDALTAGACVGVVGEPGVGKTALLASALRQVRPRGRVLHARPPAARDTAAWLGLWSPELRKHDTSVIAGRVDELPSWAADELAGIVRGGAQQALSLTAPDPSAVPEPLARLLDVVVEVPPLRHRSADVMPLAEHFAERTHRTVRFTPAAARALRTFSWPGNAEQLFRTVRDAASRSTVIDVRHLPPEMLSSSPTTLTRIEALERDEIVRCLAEHGMSVTETADTLGLSRATTYRRISRYGISVPRS
ncbi:helix-turn-helix domain-containing protein [Pseudonocardia sp. KRD291]|uniref:helix-turn-helix domain-containing protein n=1 Tax=Pseudonocardia sp. KRD291 TaxID=2792007 RepID=UPI001C4A1815|nr:helix-turn-helix domain-containing protein [Pseudonocardia sp. KRD291]MBW0102555.1 helix-turn-helix domain-containing protein [Pseudonocardia sp. KRD291]